MSTQHNQEIDLLELIVKLYHFFKKRFILITIFLLLGIIIGLTKTNISEKHYESQLIGRATIIPDQLVADIVNDINEQKEKDNLNYISKKLNLSIELIDNIREITIDTLSYGGFKLLIQVNDNTILDSLQIGLMHLFNNNTYINNERELRLKQYKELILKIDEEINYLNSLKTEKANSSNIIIEEKSSLSNRIIGLYTKKHSIEKKQIYSTNAIEIIQEFTETDKPVNIKTKNVALYSFVFLFLGVLIAFVLEFKAKFSTK